MTAITNDVIEKMEQLLPPVVSRSELPRLLGSLVNPASLVNMTREGKGPNGFRMGRKIFYFRGDFISWLKERITPISGEK